MIASHESFENQNARFWIEKGILFFEYKANTAIDLQVAVRVVADRIAFKMKGCFLYFVIQGG